MTALFEDDTILIGKVDRQVCAAFAQHHRRLARETFRAAIVATVGTLMIFSLLSEQRRRMVEDQIRHRGVTDERVLSALASVPRESFIPPEFQDLAYEDRAVPIGLDQTISQPYIVAYMTEQLQVSPHHRVLEIGTGTGYQTAVLSRLAACVYSVERLGSLQGRAAEILSQLGIGNVRFRVGDGTLGWIEEAPFDRIMVTAAAPRVPPSLLDQLADGGILIAPLGGWQNQHVTRIERSGDNLIETPLLACRFVKLLGEEGWHE